LFIQSIHQSLRIKDTNDALHYYKSENVNTTNGVLNITTSLQDNEYRAFHEKTKKYYLDTKHVQSAMVQGWNKFCMTGGIVEYNAKLPGKGSIGGLWPACKFHKSKKGK
jgi:beta-glucanase (GH16 family)